MMDKQTAASSLPTPEPLVFEEAAPFWAGAKNGALMLPFCGGCEKVIWYPKAFCNACGASDVQWRQASGRGELYSFTEVHRGEGAYRDTPSFVLALVDLDEGVRMLTNIVECAPEALRIGQRVGVVFHDAGPVAALPRFKPL